MTCDIATAAADDTRLVKVSGAPRTGKTEALVQRAAELVAAGTAPESIWIEVSSGFAADELRRRLADACQAAGTTAADAARVRVAPVSDVCRDLLGTEAARASVGVAPRVLTGAERKFLLEDMKTTGAKNRKLRSLLRMFAREWAAFEPERSWLAPGEPTDIMELLMRKLRNLGAMLPEELAFRCATYLKSEVGADARHQFAYVLADDFQNLSRAEQAVVCACAGVQLVVAGNPDQTVTVGSEFPHPQGFADFEALRHGVSCHELSQAFGNEKALRAAVAITRAGNPASPVVAEPPSADASTEDAAEGFVRVRWNTPSEELNGMTKYLRDLLDDHDVLARTYIVAPNRLWLRSVVDVCRQRDFKVDLSGTSKGIGGDPREPGRARALMAYVKLALLADPKSAVAWRCWCGFGNHLLNSDAWMHLEDYAAEREIGVVEALEQVAGEVARGEEPFLRCKILARAWEEGCALIEADARRRGFALMHAIGAEKLPEFADIVRFIAGDETAAELFALVYREMLSPHFSDDDRCLRFVTLDRMCGLSADNIVVLGCVNGFVPPRDAFEVVSIDEEREKLTNASRRALASAMAKADTRLVLSYFARTDLELAEKTKMQVARVRSENGARVALIRPSCFIDDLAEADPGATGGEQFLAEHGL